MVGVTAFWSLAAAVATTVSLPVLLVSYIAQVIAAHFRAERDIYEMLDDRYADFQKLAFEHPRLDVGDVPFNAAPDLSAQEVAQQQNLYQVLISTFERAYKMCAPGERLIQLETTQEQWVLWSTLMARYAKRAPFRLAFKATRGTWIAPFEAYIAELIRREEPVAKGPDAQAVVSAP